MLSTDRFPDCKLGEAYAEAMPTRHSPKRTYSLVSNIGDIWSLEEGWDESSVVLDIDEVGLDAVLQKFV